MKEFEVQFSDAQAVIQDKPRVPGDDLCLPSREFVVEPQSIFSIQVSADAKPGAPPFQLDLGDVDVLEPQVEILSPPVGCRLQEPFRLQVNGLIKVKIDLVLPADGTDHT